MKDIYGNNKYTQWLQDIYNAMEESEKFLPHGAWAWGTTEKPTEDTQVSDAPHFWSYSMVHKRGKLTSELPPSNPLLSCLPVLDL